MEHLKRYEIYKDKMKKYVVEKLQNDGLKPKTLAQMSNRASNINIAKKIVGKLARTYAGGVSRSTGEDTSTEQVSAIAQILEIDQKMKKADRYLELANNCIVLTLPEANESESAGDSVFYNLKTKVMLPWQYDVIEDAGDREQMRVLILSDFHDTSYSHSDGTDQTIADADSYMTGNTKQYIWWSDKHHFTTDGEGRIIQELSPEESENPIYKLPGTKVAAEQDGKFWAEGGEDLIEGSILVNTIITDLLSIAFIQGWGQIVITGKNIKSNPEGGPHNALVLEYDPDADEPKPDFQVVSANPPIESWLKIVEQYVALLLTTNDLSPSTVSMKLDVSNMASGIAMIVEMAEATNNIEDKQKEFSDAERSHWEVIKRWHNYYYDKKLLSADFAGLGRIDDQAVVSVKFNDLKPIITEKEKLEIIEKRRALGLNTEAEIIMRDNPGMSSEEAEEKLLKIREEQTESIHRAFAGSLDESINQSSDSEGQADMGETGEAEQVTSPEISLNGAQVSSLLSVIENFKNGLIDREAAKNIIRVSFALSEEDAESMLPR
jgi:hypothetical protein